MDSSAPRVADWSVSRSFEDTFANPRKGLSRCRSAAWIKRKDSMESLYARLRTAQVRGERKCCRGRHECIDDWNIPLLSQGWDIKRCRAGVVPLGTTPRGIRFAIPLPEFS